VEMILTGEGHLLIGWQCIIAKAGSHLEGDRCHTLTMTLRDFICVIYYMMCNMSYVECRYSILNGLIDSREVRRAKATGSSRRSRAASRQSPQQGAVDDARL
jgi:hypothetical protein